MATTYSNGRVPCVRSPKRSVYSLKDNYDSYWEYLPQDDEPVEQELRPTPRSSYPKVLGLYHPANSRTANNAYTWKPLINTGSIEVALLHLPHGGSIPAHDHPRTYGISVVLTGKPTITQVSEEGRNSTTRKKLKPGNWSFIFPHRNNVHAFDNHDSPAVILSIQIKIKHKTTRKKWRFSAQSTAKHAMHTFVWLSLVALSQPAFPGECGLEEAMSELKLKHLNAAIHLLEGCAHSGDPNAQNKLGDLYFIGQGVKQDYYEAAKWYRNAADQGVPDAQYHYGLMLLEGLGITDDANEGLDWIFKAMQAGHPEAKQTFYYLLAHPEPLDC